MNRKYFLLINRCLRGIRMFSSLKVNDSILVTKQLSQSDVDLFSRLTGDFNPIHSGQTDTPIVHGALLNGLVSGVIGTRLPGPGTVVVSQNFNFPNKCVVDQAIEISVRIVEVRKIIRVVYECRQDDRIVFVGDAKLIMSKSNV